MTTGPYTPPDLCVGTWRLNDADSECLQNEKKIQEEYVAEQLAIAGVPLNVFKLLGVHEQGRLVDLTGDGSALSSGAAAGYAASNAFITSPSLTWRSAQVGTAVVTTPSYIGYNFGTKKNPLGGQAYGPPAPVFQHITTIKIQQSSDPNKRAQQIKIERADGKVEAQTPSFTGVGNGTLTITSVEPSATQDLLTITATSPTSFTVSSVSAGIIGTAMLGVPFRSSVACLTISAGSIPFVVGDTFFVELHLAWQRVDIVNLPNTGNLETVNLKQSAPAPYWRIIPTAFAGISSSESWEIIQLQLMDYQATSLDNIQDMLLQENRDRDYASSSVQIFCQYSPADNFGDLGRFGLSIAEQYAFTVSFAEMVRALGRPIVVGDIIELPAEMQYDHNLRPVKKYLEIVDASWAADGFSPQWRPLIYRFQAQQLIPSVETRDIVGPTPSQLIVDDASFFNEIQQINKAALDATKAIEAEAKDAVPEIGQDSQSLASGTKAKSSAVEKPNTSDAQDAYIEDALPPAGVSYSEGYELPDIPSSTDGQYFRLNYPESTNIPSKLFRYSALKNKWIYLESDRRNEYSSFKPSVRKILTSTTKKSIKKK